MKGWIRGQISAAEILGEGDENFYIAKELHSVKWSRGGGGEIKLLEI